MTNELSKRFWDHRIKSQFHLWALVIVIVVELTRKPAGTLFTSRLSCTYNCLSFTYIRTRFAALAVQEHFYKINMHMNVQ